MLVQRSWGQVDSSHRAKLSALLCAAWGGGAVCERSSRGLSLLGGGTALASSCTSQSVVSKHLHLGQGEALPCPTRLGHWCPCCGCVHSPGAPSTFSSLGAFSAPHKHPSTCAHTCASMHTCSCTQKLKIICSQTFTYVQPIHIGFRKACEGVLLSPQYSSWGHWVTENFRAMSTHGTPRLSRAGI